MRRNGSAFFRRPQLNELTFASANFNSVPVESLARDLAAISPANLTRVHLRSSGGSIANEGAIRIALHYTGKSDVVSLFRSHIGHTFAMNALSGFNHHRSSFPNVFPGTLHVPSPCCSRCFYKQQVSNCGLLCVSRIDDFIQCASSGSVGCVLIEPILAVGGNIIPPQGYFDALKTFCEELGILLMFDECQTGFGRCGEIFAADYFGVSPHIMTVAKGISGVRLPLGGIHTEERLLDRIRSFMVLLMLAGCLPLLRL